MGEKRKEVLRIPHASVGEVLGLVEFLTAYGGKMRISELMDELPMEIDDLGDVIDMAELLNLVEVDEGEIKVTLYGETISVGSIDDKKRVLHKKLEKVEPFKTALQLLKKKKVMSEQELMRILLKKFDIEMNGNFHELFTNWGSYAELFEYDADEHVFRLFH
jgi:NitT/TauT family transport system ATP-binding protein